MVSSQFSGFLPLDSVFTVSSTALFASSIVLQRAILKKPRFFTTNHTMNLLFRPTLFAWKVFSTTSIITASTFASSLCILMAVTGSYTPREFGMFLRRQLSFARVKPIPNDIDTPSWSEDQSVMETENNFQ
ncbi:Schizosaccharomyces specific protein [Schizosaccharomyces osmophilus]|uniref:Schizosaccharomyces specific protein n=1 Tax=Schizosaccharomyces osmophilus TaxID=2545709 RepID=A0AAF0AVN4_9SCHI|nr:Schizosaccharomyces specific protein [Schizosaccharomyces osmophilus]WBW72200.1 Schizosaccharomyces specific protein [Schizosaccharomyces osmophilus]